MAAEDARESAPGAPEAAAGTGGRKTSLRQGQDVDQTSPPGSPPGQEKLAELAETLEEHRGLLLRLDAAREQHEATMHAQSKWIVRQVAVLLRDCALRGGGEAAAGQQQDAAPEVPSLRERRGNLVYPLTVAIPEMSFEEQESAESAESSLRAASPSRPRRVGGGSRLERYGCDGEAGAGGGAAVALRDADGVGGGAPMRPRLSSRVSFDVSCAESSDAESGSPNRTPSASGQPHLLYPSQASTGQDDGDRGSTDTCPTLPNDALNIGSLEGSVSSEESRFGFGSRLTPAGELENLEAALSRLRNSRKNFFVWGLTNSGDRRHGITDTTLGRMAFACTHSITFEMLVPIVIVANAAVIGYQADWDMRHVGSSSSISDDVAFKWVNRAFTLAFLLELAIRIMADGAVFFYISNKGFGWNLFDTFIVSASIAEEVVAFVSSTRLSQASSVRVVRTLRLVRAFRAIRVMRFFRELRIMVSGIMNCGRSVLWASLLISIMTYTFAVLFLQVSSSWLREQDDVGLDCDGDAAGVACSVGSSFSTLIEGMYTLFKAMSGGSSWGDVSDPLTSIHPLVTFAFCVYIMLAVFVVLNVITAIFVEAATRQSGDEATKVLDNIQRKSEWIKRAKELFTILDTRRAGWLGYDEIDKLFTDERAQSFLQEFGIDIDFQSTQVLLNLFDSEGLGGVDQDQFAKKLHRLHGSARSLDLARIHSMACQTHKTLRMVSRRIDSLAGLMGISLSPSRRTVDGPVSPPRRQSSGVISPVRHRSTN